MAKTNNPGINILFYCIFFAYDLRKKRFFCLHSKKNNKICYLRTKKKIDNSRWNSLLVSLHSPLKRIIIFDKKRCIFDTKNLYIEQYVADNFYALHPVDTFSPLHGRDWILWVKRLPFTWINRKKEIATKPYTEQPILE